MYELTELYADGRKEELDKELHAFQRFGKLLRDGAGDSLSYQAGVIAGAAAAIGMLARKSSARDRFNRKMSALLQEEACRKILSYLYGHPGSQCRVIARDLGIQPDDLDRQLADLEEAGGVVHHGVDESSFYELTLDGQAFVEENRRLWKKTDVDSRAIMLYTNLNKTRDAAGVLCAKSRVFCCPPRLWSTMRNPAGFLLQKIKIIFEIPQKIAYTPGRKQKKENRREKKDV